LLAAQAVFLVLGSLDSTRSEAIDANERPIGFDWQGRHSEHGQQQGVISEEAGGAIGTPSPPPTSISPSTNKAQQAGQAARGRAADNPGNVSRYGEGEETDGYRSQTGEDDLRQGRSAGQVSNVPGTTSTSPNGTGSLYGTDGIPVFPGDLHNK
jgi:hypothetical protein